MLVLTRCKELRMRLKEGGLSTFEVKGGGGYFLRLNHLSFTTSFSSVTSLSRSMKCSLQACPIVTSFAMVLLNAGFARRPKQCPCFVNTGRVSGYFSSTSYTFESLVIFIIK